MDTRTDRDDALLRFARSLIDATRATWGEGFVTEPNAPGNPVHRYSETHYALAAALLGLEMDDGSLFDLAAARLELWDRGGGPMTFFNSMAVCLTAIELDRAEQAPDRLCGIIRQLLARTRDHEHVAFGQWCGNNAYLQQVAVDTVLAPLARGTSVDPERVARLVGEFNRFRTPEGFFFDLPRVGSPHERLCPPAYIMKILFLAGVCHELTRNADLGTLVTRGMSAVLPLLTDEGQAAYFGRTDNSPFAAGLTVFNLRRAESGGGSGDGAAYAQAARRAEQYYLSFPRTAEDLLRCNRFRDPESQIEYFRSHDHYAYVGQYSLASCAYALMALRWHPDPGATMASGNGSAPGPSVSHDLAVAKLVQGRSSLIVRTAGEITSRDRRYLGPTLLRLRCGDRLLVGAPPITVSSDPDVVTPAGKSRTGRIFHLLRRRFESGFEQLDGTSVGFLPLLRKGGIDYLPGAVGDQESGPNWIRASYPMLRLAARGWRPCATELDEILRNRIPWLGPRRYIPPAVRAGPPIVFERLVVLEAGRCRIEDRIVGNLHRMRLVFTVRCFPDARVTVSGLNEGFRRTAWGSDGRQALIEFSGTGLEEMRYTCEIA